MKKLAFWQLAMIILSLTTFFITRHFTVDKEVSTYITIVVTVMVMVYSILSCNLNASAAAVATLSIIAFSMDDTWTAFLVPIIVLVAIFMTNIGISKKKLLFMYSIQFAIISMSIITA